LFRLETFGAENSLRKGKRMPLKRSNSVDEAESDSGDEEETGVTTVDTRKSLHDLAHRMRVQALKLTTQSKEGSVASCNLNFTMTTLSWRSQNIS
jgi:hypothetical protein